jgi:excisionase family DNA binding protein
MEDRQLSLSEVAGLMGVSERTVRRWIKSGKLRAYKPGRDYRIPETAVRTFVEESEISPKARRSSLEPSLFNGLEDERRLDNEAALAVLFRGLARRARLIVERSRREGPSAELGEEAAALHAEASALYRLRGPRDIRGTGSDELADAVDAYEEVEGTIQAMLRQDVVATDEEREIARRFRRDARDASKRGEADAS